MTIILLHGTWAVNAKWTLLNSTISQTLRKAFPDACIKRYPWSGSNSAEQRARAASKLAKEIFSIWEAGCTEDWVLIGHSHGGNVAVAAAALISELGSELQNAPLEAPDQPRPVPHVYVICLATPFLSAIESSVNFNRLTWLISAALGVVTAIVGRMLIINHFPSRPVRRSSAKWPGPSASRCRSAR
jgi:pimeloyl-ACP methyl ester carboxylesterase